MQQAGAGWSCGWEVERDEERHLDFINPLFFIYSLGQCQQLEESGKIKHYELWELHLLEKKKSVSLYYSQSVCLYYILQVGVAPKRQREVCPLTALCIAKENKHHCDNCKYYVIIPSEYYEFMFY